MKPGDYFRIRMTDKSGLTISKPNKKEYGVRQVDDREHTRLYKALTDQGMPSAQAHAVAYDIIESGKFDESRLPKGYSADPIRALMEEIFKPSIAGMAYERNGHSRLLKK